MSKKASNILCYKVHKNKCNYVICPIDGKKFINLNKLSYHFRIKHKIKYVDYLIDTILKEKYKGVWPLCKCGCGKKVPFYKMKFSLYCKGHHHKGKTFSKHAKRNMSIGVKKWLNSLTKEERSKIAKKIVSARNENSYSNANKKFYSSKKYREKMSVSVSKALTNTEIKKRMIEGQIKWLRKKGPNNFEQKILDVTKKIFKDDDVVFQFSIDGINHKYDIGIPSKKIIIEAYGTYWHGDPYVYGKKNLEKWQKINNVIDKKYVNLARKNGYTVIIIWERQKDEAFSIIKEAIKK